MFSNFHSVSNRAFTAPGIDGKTYCNIGPAYADASLYSTQTATQNGAYPAPGEVMIHELTHAWQIAHNSFLPGFVCSGVINQANFEFGDDVYAYGLPGQAWSSFNLEQQGAIVDQWFAGNNNNGSMQSAFGPKDTTSNPYYQYISSNILTGSAGYSNSRL